MFFMGDQLDSIINELKQNTLSVEQIEESNFTRDNLFEVKIGSAILGPFSAKYLKTLSEEKNLMDFNVLVKTMESILWVPVFQHPSFFHSDGGMENVPEIKKKSFYLLVNGRKVGPYRIEDIDFKVKNSEMLFTDLISEDAGNSWKKLYELEGFDLRRHQEEELPTAPGGSVLEKAKRERGKEEGLDVVGELAKIGHQSSSKDRRYSTEDFSRGRPLLPRIINLAIFVGIVFASIFIFDKLDPFGPSKDPVVAKKRPAPKKVKTKRRTPPPKKRVVSPPPSRESLEEKKTRRKKAISRRKKPQRKKVVKSTEDNPYPEDDNYIDEEPEYDYDEEAKPKPKKKVVKKKKTTNADDEYYDEDAEEEDPY